MSSGSLYARCATVNGSGSVSAWVVSSAVSYVAPASGGGTSTTATEVDGAGAGSYSLTAAYANVQASGVAPLGITLAAGAWMIETQLAIIGGGTAGDTVAARWYNSTGSAAVANSEVYSTVATASGETQISCTSLVNPTGTTTYNVQAYNTVAARGTMPLVRCKVISVSLSAGTMVNLTQITSFSPTYGVSGASITITGQGFTGATSVTLGGFTCVFTVNSDTSITATVPSGATSGGYFVVTSPGGSATSTTAFSYGTFSPNSLSPSMWLDYRYNVAVTTGGAAATVGGSVGYWGDSGSGGQQCFQQF